MNGQHLIDGPTVLTICNGCKCLEMGWKNPGYRGFCRTRNVWREIGSWSEMIPTPLWCPPRARSETMKPKEELARWLHAKHGHRGFAESMG